MSDNGDKVAARRQDEEEIRALCEQGRFDEAVTRAVRRYGPEVTGYVVGVLGDADRADDVVGDLYLKLLEGLAAFEWRSSLRTWLYTVARYSIYGHRRRPGDAPQRHERISHDSAHADDLRWIREQTTIWRQTATKDKFAELRRQHLSDDEQTLLILRVDRDMAWEEVAEVLGRPAATLRKRYERLTLKLHDLAREHGLVPAARD